MSRPPAGPPQLSLTTGHDPRAASAPTSAPTSATARNFPTSLPTATPPGSSTTRPSPRWEPSLPPLASSNGGSGQMAPQGRTPGTPSSRSNDFHAILNPVSADVQPPSSQAVPSGHSDPAAMIQPPPHARSPSSYPQDYGSASQYSAQPPGARLLRRTQSNIGDFHGQPNPAQYRPYTATSPALYEQSQQSLQSARPPAFFSAPPPATNYGQLISTLSPRQTARQASHSLMPHGEGIMGVHSSSVSPSKTRSSHSPPSHISPADPGSSSRKSSFVPDMTSPTRPGQEALERGGPSNLQGGAEMLSATGEGEYGEYGPILLDIQSGSKVADEKRRRNAGASARFRARRKEKEREASSRISDLQQQIQALAEDADFYRRERDYFANIILAGPDRHLHFPRPVSPRRLRAAQQPPSGGAGPSGMGSPSSINAPAVPHGYNVYPEAGPFAEADRHSKRRLTGYSSTPNLLQASQQSALSRPSPPPPPLPPLPPSQSALQPPPAAAPGYYPSLPAILPLPEAAPRQVPQASPGPPRPPPAPQPGPPPAGSAAAPPPDPSYVIPSHRYDPDTRDRQWPPPSTRAER